MNLFVGIGRLTSDPTVNYSQNTGKAVTKFTVAIDRPVAKGAEKQTDFISCVAFGKSAETIGNYFSKGQRIAIEGSLRIGSYTDKQGNKRTSADIFVNNFHFVEKRGSQAQNQGGGFEDMGTIAESFEAPAF